MKSWYRDDSKAGIDVSASGWDAEMISYPHVFELDGTIYMAYLGIRWAAMALAWHNLRVNYADPELA